MASARYSVVVVDPKTMLPGVVSALLPWEEARDVLTDWSARWTDRAVVLRVVML